MKKLFLIFIIIITTSVFAQYRDDGLNKPGVKEGIVNQSSGYAFGFLNSENFLMRHSFSLSFTSFGGNGISLGTYTNSMYYKLMNNLNVQMDISMIFSPYSSFGKSFQDDINGIYISSAAVNYAPFKDMNISIQYRSLPYGSYYSNPFYGSFYGFYNNPFREYDH
ncbi:MAG: hypothetical protein IH819_10695 [Bacteroidetes bacterium]|nr:hypothetical protein [Bacteroidota bacterium]